MCRNLLFVCHSRAPTVNFICTECTNTERFFVAIVKFSSVIHQIVKFQLKIVASQLHVRRDAFQFFYSIETRVSLKRKQRREQRVCSRALLIEDGIHKSLHFSASTPGLGFAVTWKTLPRRCYQKPPDRKSTLKRQQRERWTG